MKIFSTSILILLILLCHFLRARENQKNRAIVLTDIENEPDDCESLVRLMLYSNVIDIKGIIATTSTHMRNIVHPESIQRVIRGYGKVHNNLINH